MAVEFRLLGPLEVVGDDGPLPLGGPKQRALLALLLLRANEVVSTDAIVDALWSGEPPPTAPAYVQNCVSRLRKTLGAEVLETRSPGYVLRVDEDAVDARRFERLVREARDFAAQERAAAIREALALWRGSPLSDLAYEGFAQGEIVRLEDLRLSALEERVEAELELGLHAELVGELEALAREHEAREPLRRMQMLALYRAGRQVDALAAYQETRLALVERYGVEPSEELRALERMILTHDTLLDLAVASARAAPPPTREVRKTVTVLFADLADSTGLSERLDPESLRRLMSRVFAELRTAVELHEGTVEKFSGDDVMAVFGVPQAHEDDAARAVRAAVRMREALAALNDEVVLQWGVRLALRIGVNTGEVMAGDASDGQAFVTGNAVNVAKRIQQAAAPGEILVGAATHRLAADAVATEPVEPIQARARSAPIEAYRVTGFADAAVVRRFDAPLVGRTEELARLGTAVDEVVRKGACLRLLVVGEPGIGKSRLVAELVGSIEADVRVVTGRCVAYGEGATYLPLVDVLNQVAPGGGELRERLTGVLSANGDADVVAERLASVAGSGASAGSSAEVFWAVRRLLETLTRERPLVLVFEDVHWAEPTCLDLVEYLAGWTEAPVLLLCLSRPELLETRPQWGEGALSLAPLAHDEARELVDALPGRQALGASFDELLDTAAGVPLFLEQLTALAAETELQSGTVPANVEALIASRLDRLDPWERGVLDRAAVAGREFWRGAVDELSPENERASVGPRLLALARRRLVRPDRSALPGEDGFRFHHALIRDVAYAAIPKGERARLHERLARWLDARGGEHDELVGYHLEQAARYREQIGAADAELSEEAGARLAEAGLRVLLTDYSAASNLLGRATTLLREGLRKSEIECAFAAAIKFSGDTDRADALLEDIARQAIAASSCGRGSNKDGRDSFEAG